MISATESVGGATARTNAGVEPLYFGRGVKRLFGCYHAAAAARPASPAIVICQPVGQEYIRCHRMLRVLADMLARVGVPVFRFDYHGCGDSHGDSEEATLSRCVEDLEEAIRFMRGRSRVLRVELLGVRLGAAIALRYTATRRGQTERLMLWDPVVYGQNFLETMREENAHYSKRMRGLFGRPPSPDESDGPCDFIGFRFSTQMVDELSQLDLCAIGQRPCTRALILDSDSSPAVESLHGHLKSIGVAAVLKRLSSPKIWLTEPNQGLVPHAALDFLVNWILESPT